MAAMSPGSPARRTPGRPALAAGHQAGRMPAGSLHPPGQPARTATARPAHTVISQSADTPAAPPSGSRSRRGHLTTTQRQSHRVTDGTLAGSAQCRRYARLTATDDQRSPTPRSGRYAPGRSPPTPNWRRRIALQLATPGRAAAALLELII